MNKLKQVIAEIIGDGKLFEEAAEKRPGPFAQGTSRALPSKEQREHDYLQEKRETGEALKRRS
jgi:hypothetical protein